MYPIESEKCEKKEKKLQNFEYLKKKELFILNNKSFSQFLKDYNLVKK